MKQEQQLGDFTRLIKNTTPKFVIFIFLITFVSRISYRQKLKKSRYISFTLLLLLVVALFCRLSATFLCGCNEDHHHDDHHHEHVCCSCPDHISDCSHHDKKYSDHSCHFHFGTDNTLAEQANIESKNSGTTHPNRGIIILAYNILTTSTLSVKQAIIHSFDRYHFSVIEWGSVSIPLRAPPVLV